MCAAAPWSATSAGLSWRPKCRWVLPLGMAGSADCIYCSVQPKQSGSERALAASYCWVLATVHQLASFEPPIFLPIPLRPQDPLRSAQLLAEHDGYPAAIARLLQPLREVSRSGGQVPVPALRLLRRLVAAAGSPFDCAYTLEMLMQPACGCCWGAGAIVIKSCMQVVSSCRFGLSHVVV